LEDEVARLAREVERRVGWVERQVTGATAPDAEGGNLDEQVSGGFEENRKGGLLVH
jgi:hypothetical protein